MFGFRALPRTIAAAERDLGDAKVAVRRSVVTDLVRLAGGDDRDAALGLLAKILERDADLGLRADAAVALADVGAEEHVAALIDASFERHPRLRQMALLALGELARPGDSRVERVLAQTLNASEPALRFQALLASARLSISDLPARLQSALSDVDPPLRYLALRLIDEHWERCLSRTTLLQQAAQALQDSDRQVRVGAALLPWETLPGAEGRGGHAPAAEVRTRVEQVLLEAIEARIALPAPEDEQALIERVAHLQLVGAISGLRRIAWGRFGLPSGALAYQARVALLSLGDETAVQHFKKALGSRRTAICAQAVVAVTEARAAALGPEIEALARRGDVDSELIESARTALAQHSAR